MSAIDLDTLREMLASAERMIPYYAKQVATERAQNAAMEAAGQPPLHSATLVKMHEESVALCTREAEVLRHVIAYHSGEIYVPGEAVGAQAEAA